MLQTRVSACVKIRSKKNSCKMQKNHDWKGNQYIDCVARCVSSITQLKFELSVLIFALFKTVFINNMPENTEFYNKKNKRGNQLCFKKQGSNRLMNFMRSRLMSRKIGNDSVPPGEKNLMRIVSGHHHFDR